MNMDEARMLVRERSLNNLNNGKSWCERNESFIFWVLILAIIVGGFATISSSEYGALIVIPLILIFGVLIPRATLRPDNIGGDNER